MLLPPPAAAIEPHQIEAIERLAGSPPPGQSAVAFLARHYAVLLWVEDYCDGRSVESVRAYLAQKGKSDPDGFEAGWMDAFDLLGKTDPKSMCPLAAQLYGPEGTQIRGAWHKK